MTNKTSKRPARTVKARATRSRASGAVERGRVILKQGFCFDHRTAKSKPVPELVIIADRAGFQWLSEYFKACAKRTKRLSGMPVDLAIEEHWHLSLRLPPFDQELSDEIELRVVPFDVSTRDRLLDRYGVDRKRAKRGSLIKRSAKMVAEIKRCMVAMHRRSR
ncbi:MAG: hypothetical protein U0625_04580 [Phycisphaerales bacterium]